MCRVNLGSKFGEVLRNGKNTTPKMKKAIKLIESDLEDNINFLIDLREGKADPENLKFKVQAAKILIDKIFEISNKMSAGAKSEKLKVEFIDLTGEGKAEK